MLKHGRIYPRKKGWTMRYLHWLQEQRFDHPAHQLALQEMVEAVRVSKERVERLEKVIEEFVPNWSLGPVVRVLQTLRGVDLIVARHPLCRAAGTYLHGATPANVLPFNSASKPRARQA